MSSVSVQTPPADMAPEESTPVAAWPSQLLAATFDVATYGFAGVAVIAVAAVVQVTAGLGQLPALAVEHVRQVLSVSLSAAAAAMVLLPAAAEFGLSLFGRRTVGARRYGLTLARADGTTAGPVEVAARQVGRLLVVAPLLLPGVWRGAALLLVATATFVASSQRRWWFDHLLGLVVLQTEQTPANQAGRRSNSQGQQDAALSGGRWRKPAAVVALLAHVAAAAVVVSEMPTRSVGQTSALVVAADDAVQLLPVARRTFGGVACDVAEVCAQAVSAYSAGDGDVEAVAEDVALVLRTAGFKAEVHPVDDQPNAPLAISANSPHATADSQVMVLVYGPELGRDFATGSAARPSDGISIVVFDRSRRWIGTEADPGPGPNWVT